MRKCYSVARNASIKDDPSVPQALKIRLAPRRYNHAISCELKHTSFYDSPVIETAELLFITDMWDLVFHFVTLMSMTPASGCVNNMKV
jgi:hypothetical protein